MATVLECLEADHPSYVVELLHMKGDVGGGF